MSRGLPPLRDMGSDEKTKGIVLDLKLLFLDLKGRERDQLSAPKREL